MTGVMEMPSTTNVAFKEWAVVVDALGAGEQIVIFRKGGIREQGGAFHVDHRAFWLFPTQYHETEQLVVADKRERVRTLAAQAQADVVPIRYFARADRVVMISDPSQLSAWEGRHIWTESVLCERFEFGRGRGLYAMMVRVYALPSAELLPMRDAYAGCKSWVELERSLETAHLAPVMEDREFAKQRDDLMERMTPHAITHL